MNAMTIHSLLAQTRPAGSGMGAEVILIGVGLVLTCVLLGVFLYVFSRSDQNSDADNAQS